MTKTTLSRSTGTTLSRSAGTNLSHSAGTNLSHSAGTNLSRSAGEVETRSVEGEGDRVASPHSVASQHPDAVCRPGHPHPRRSRVSTSPAQSEGEVSYSFGPAPLPSGQTRFRLWAPAQESVSLALEAGDLVPMQRSPDGWFETVTPCPPGTRYRFRLADGMLVPDPASRSQPDDVHGPSSVIDPQSYVWRNTEWRGRPWRETVLYELHAGLLGGFAGVARELPRLRDLGITAVELMPVNDFPGRRNWGYDGVLPYAPDSAYGTPDDLKALVDAAHGHGLMMFLDVVYNHFGPDGNYLHAYAPQFFGDGQATPWGPAIDFRRPEVRAFFTENVLMWLMQYRFDGLRFDALHAIDDQSWVDEMAATVRATIEPGRHVHLVLEHHNDASHLQHDCDAQWNDDGHHVLHVLLTGEDNGYYADYADRPAHRLARCLAEGWIYQGEHASYYGTQRGDPSAHLSPSAHVLFLQNHDQIGNRAFGERLTVLTEPKALEAAIALLLLSPQIPLLFMGEECASRSPFLFFTDHAPELAQAVREGRRNEFSRFADFADPAKRERIADPNAPGTFQASLPLPDPEQGPARTGFYRNLIALRMREIVPLLDGARMAGAQVIGPKAVVVTANLSRIAGEVVERSDAGEGDRVGTQDKTAAGRPDRPHPQLLASRLGQAPGGMPLPPQAETGILTIATNLDAAPVPFDTPAGRLLFANAALPTGMLPGHCTAAFLDQPA